MSESTKDLVVALALVAFGVATLVVLAHTHNNGAHVADVLDFATLPRLYGLLLLGLSVLLAATSLVRKRREMRSGAALGRAPSPLSNPVVLGRAAGTVVLTALYVVGLERLQFFPVTAVFLAAMFLLYGRRPLWGVGLAALLGAAALDVVFIRVINLPLH